uniref:Uncharacterized protein n=1 Tax=Acrobeloides nanus TaxID=290746 RepID=A0A914CHW8_9BILA
MKNLSLVVLFFTFSVFFISHITSSPLSAEQLKASFGQFKKHFKASPEKEHFKASPEKKTLLALVPKTKTIIVL